MSKKFRDYLRLIGVILWLLIWFSLETTDQKINWLIIGYILDSFLDNR